MSKSDAIHELRHTARTFPCAKDLAPCAKDLAPDETTASVPYLPVRLDEIRVPGASLATDGSRLAGSPLARVLSRVTADGGDHTISVLNEGVTTAGMPVIDFSHGNIMRANMRAEEKV